MALFETGTLIELREREAVSLADVRGVTLRVTRGLVWVTQEHDPADVILRVGDNWTVERDGRTVLEAQADAVVVVVGRGVAPVGAAQHSRAEHPRSRADWVERFARLFPLERRQPLHYF